MTRRWAGREEGSIAPAVPVLALVLLMLAGLVVDASRQLTARARAVAYAEEAARAGAAAIDLDAEDLRLLPVEQVRERVDAYCEAAAAAGAPIVDPRHCFRGTTEDGDPLGRRIVVETHVEVELRTTLLGIVGVQRLRAAGDGRARPFEGTSEEDVTCRERRSC
ncbi:pilus assembly protein TadG-related protein [Kineococcus sp. SYSU DK006]|uniref:pilus assembly protein TadG-related protein n=1 Tax=Kineococcus sp. SYSU DK006 TaxID=3383127 RepID=UPI003D7D7974